MQKLMDSLYNNKSSKMVKLKNPNGGVSPLMMKYLSSNSSSNSSSSPPVDPFSPLSKMSKYSGKSSSSSTSSLSAVFDEDDVLVMDGILVNLVSSGSNNHSNSDFYKTELCRSWEDLGKCRFGAKCQFAHGKEELRSTRLSISKNRSEAQMCKSYITGSCIYGSKCRFLHQGITDAALLLTTQTASPVKPDHTIKTPIAISMAPERTSESCSSTLNPEQSSNNPSLSWTCIANQDYWSPEDDGIEVALPPHRDKPSREKIDAHIDSVLYCRTARRRLPVFAEICPE